MEALFVRNEALMYGRAVSVNKCRLFGVKYESSREFLPRAKFVFLFPLDQSPLEGAQTVDMYGVNMVIWSNTNTVSQTYREQNYTPSINSHIAVAMNINVRIRILIRTGRTVSRVTLCKPTREICRTGIVDAQASFRRPLTCLHGFF